MHDNKPNCLARRRIRQFLLAFSALCILSSGSIYAADANQDELLRQQQRLKAEQDRLQSAPDVRLDNKPVQEALTLPLDETPCFKIDRLALQGELSEQFQWVLQDSRVGVTEALHQCLGANAINVLMKRMQNAVIAKGFVTTRVLAAPQDLTQGTLTLTLVPGRIHAIRFAADTPLIHATYRNAIPAHVGDLLNLRDIEQGLENFKRIPTADANIEIEAPMDPAAKPGDSDLVIHWKQRAIPLRVSASADNSGVKSTGRYQGSVTVSGDNLLSLNDLFYATFNHDLGGGSEGNRGTRGYSLYYAIPYGNWLLSANASEYQYHQSVAGLNQNYLYAGISHNADVKLNRLLWRDATRKITAMGKLWTRDSSNYINDTEVQVQHRRMGGFELGLNDREFIGQAVLDMTATYRRGTGAFGSKPAPEEAFGEGTSRPEIWLLDVQYNQPFTVRSQPLNYSLSARAQQNETPLIPQDRFAIGGFYTVRGFDGENILSAERGLLLRNDLTLPLGSSGQALYLAVDYGQVGGQSAQNLVGDHLAGAALGVRGGIAHASYDLFIGAPIDKPKGFQTASTTVGVSVNVSY